MKKLLMNLMILFMLITLLPLKAWAADYLEKGRNLVYQGKYEEALTCYDKILKVDNENDTAWYYKGLIHHYLIFLISKRIFCKHGNTSLKNYRLISSLPFSTISIPSSLYITLFFTFTVLQMGPLSGILYPQKSMTT